MKISVIIPVYNTAIYLPECLDSVLSEIGDIEIICVNDGSTDNSLEIIELYANKNTKIIAINQLNGGLSAARNAGVNSASGDYIFFLDSDDVINEGAFEQLNRVIEVEHPDIVAFNSILWYPDEENRRVDNVGFNHLESVVYERGMGYLSYFVGTRNWGPSAVCFYLFKRTLLLDNKVIFEEGLLHEDELYMSQVLSYAGKVTTLPYSLYLYRMRSNSIVHAQCEKNYRDKIKIAHILLSFFEEQSKRNKITDRIIHNLCLAGTIGLLRLSIRSTKEEKQLLWKTANTLKEKIKIVLWIFRLRKI